MARLCDSRDGPADLPRPEDLGLETHKSIRFFREWFVCRIRCHTRFVTIDRMGINSEQLPAVLYSRVSTDDQAESGLGLADQTEKLRAMAVVKGWIGLELVDDGVSAKNLNRPAMAEALRMLAAGEAGALVVAKLDRLTRSVVDLGELMATADSEGWALIVLDLGIDTTTASGELVANVMTAVSQWERKVIGERTSAALQTLKAGGRRLGRPVALPHQVRTRIATERRLGSTYRAIADRLNTDDVPTVNGGQWRVSTVADVVNSVELDAEMADLVRAAAKTVDVEKIGAVFAEATNTVA